ncbi:hypothetical protein RFI_12616 [Reticulomyxa filosa]|uniref:Uncharacterized protein n=1 Tax=Reticulomyxa filosa TaxID=46433 RepID=X6NEW8_RETFI|nr:hypothetical protein RFI_12616 [Reticulomyxa filosa]|eukprot:ETO24541.1 hypothetical protein RFI_12616 [Reticulomyxa filosa]
MYMKFLASKCLKNIINSESDDELSGRVCDKASDLLTSDDTIQKKNSSNLPNSDFSTSRQSLESAQHSCKKCSHMTPLSMQLSQKSQQYKTLREEYDKLIEVNHQLANQFKESDNKVQMLKGENEALKKSLDNCKEILQKKLLEDGNRFANIEKLHQEWNNKYAHLHQKNSEFLTKKKYFKTAIEHLNGVIATTKSNQLLEQELTEKMKEISLQKGQILALHQKLAENEQCNTSRGNSNYIKTSNVKHLNISQTDSPLDMESTEDEAILSDIGVLELSSDMLYLLQALHHSIMKSCDPTTFHLWRHWIHSVCEHVQKKLYEDIEADINITQTKKQIPLRFEKSKKKLIIFFKCDKMFSRKTQQKNLVEARNSLTGKKQMKTTKKAPKLVSVDIWR